VNRAAQRCSITCELSNYRVNLSCECVWFGNPAKHNEMGKKRSQFVMTSDSWAACYILYTVCCTVVHTTVVNYERRVCSILTKFRTKEEIDPRTFVYIGGKTRVRHVRRQKRRSVLTRLRHTPALGCPESLEYL
jgi:hypothetical protein